MLPRCGNCFASDSHPTAECEDDAYYFNWRNAHHVRSKESPRYCLLQDILQLVDTQFISFGSERRELQYRQRAGTPAKMYVFLLGTSTAEGQLLSSTTSSRPSETIATSISLVQNIISISSWDTVKSPSSFDGASATLSKVTLVAYVHTPHTASLRIAEV